MTGVVTVMMQKNNVQVPQASRHPHDRGGNSDDAYIMCKSLKPLCILMTGVVTVTKLLKNMTWALYQGCSQKWYKEGVLNHYLVRI